MYGPWRYDVWCRRWIRDDEVVRGCEYRVFLAPRVVVLVFRRSWTKKVVYTACVLPGVWRAWEEMDRREIVSQFLRRARAAAADAPTNSPAADEWLGTTWPTVTEYLTVNVWPDGKPRTVSSLVIFVEDGQWKGCLSDRDDGMVLFATGRSVQGLLTALEGLLTSEEPPWRMSKQAKGQTQQKGSKKA